MSKTELALPAGSLQCALYAFKGGADSVYLGLKSFSARKNAVNFSFEDIRKLKEVCLKENKKFYITLNTLVKDEELPQVYTLLKQLDYVKPDGIIVQDLGIAKMISEHFPSLELHASTQLAVHNIEGVKELQRLGFKRVVLSRELSFDEVKTIREACPDVEIKVFIHGALCYGFSGVCMASQKITGRSANCGACAQICRTWFTCKETQDDKWFFSMKDLNLGKKVLQYQDIGIDSLKIEGRMKGPEYTYWCAKYYSQILNHKDENDKEVSWAKDSMEIAFARESTEGFFDTKTAGSCGSNNMVCTKYPSHIGIRVGYIQRVINGKAIAIFEKSVALRDGLLVISNGQSAGFALTDIEGGRSFISEGEEALINFPSNEFTKKPEYGTEIRCVSRHDMNLPLISENIPLYKRDLDININIYDSSLEINNQKYEIEIQEAKNPADLNEIFTKVFESSDKSYFTLGKLTIANNSKVKNVFLPLSILKQIRRDYYASADSDFEKELEKTIPFTSIDIPKFQGDVIHFEPLMFDSQNYYNEMDEQYNNNPEAVFGINNIGQIQWAKNHPTARVVADVFLYSKNSLAYKLLKDEMPSLIGSIDDEDANVPIFISRVCFRHHSLGLPCNGCSKNNEYHITQNDKEYKVICKNCITKVIQKQK